MLNRCRVYSSTQGSNPCLTAIFLLVFTKLLESPPLSLGVGFIGVVVMPVLQKFYYEKDCLLSKMTHLFFGFDEIVARSI